MSSFIFNRIEGAPEDQPFPEAVEAAFPQAQVQLCIVHMVRNSLRYVPWKQRKAVAADLKKIYQVPSLKDAEAPLGALETTWDQEFPTISKSLACPLGAPDALFAFPKDIRRVIYTTNAIESLNSTLRKIIKARPRVFRSLGGRLIPLPAPARPSLWSVA